MSDLAARTVTIERTFNVPVQLVWDAWTLPEHIKNWWGPKGMETRVEEHNFEVGGTWKYAMAMPDGKDFICDGQYIEIINLKKIASKANFRPMTENVIIEVHLEELAEGTKFTFKVIHESVEYKNQQEQMGIYNGWGSTFDRLKELLVAA